jgi:hypothetical protein
MDRVLAHGDGIKRTIADAALLRYVCRMRRTRLHGGKRPGAGRKPILDTFEKIALGQMCREHAYRLRSEADLSRADVEAQKRVNLSHRGQAIKPNLAELLAEMDAAPIRLRPLLSLTTDEREQHPLYKSLSEAGQRALDDAAMALEDRRVILDGRAADPGTHGDNGVYGISRFLRLHSARPKGFGAASFRQSVIEAARQEFLAFYGKDVSDNLASEAWVYVNQLSKPAKPLRRKQKQPT